ncbi:MAG: hypothetical protein WBW04_11040, partial [Nitrolancea sp.]
MNADSDIAGIAPELEIEEAPARADRDDALPAVRSVWRPGPGLLVLFICLISFLASAWVSTNVFDRLPHVEDDVAFLFQAKTIASGHLLATPPQSPIFFQIPFVIIRDGHWFGKYPPGYPMVLAIGVLF